MFLATPQNLKQFKPARQRRVIRFIEREDKRGMKLADFHDDLYGQNTL